MVNTKGVIIVTAVIGDICPVGPGKRKGSHVAASIVEVGEGALRSHLACEIQTDNMVRVRETFCYVE